MQEAFATTFDHYGRLEDPTKAVRRSVLRGCASRKPDPDDPTRVIERILGRVRALGRGPRDVVALRYSLGLDAPEIDRTLGLEEGTAAMRLHEAATELRAGLEVGDDLDQTLETAFAETTAGLGHLLARPGDAQRPRVPATAHPRRDRGRGRRGRPDRAVRGAATELVGGPLDRRHGHRGDLAVERHDDAPRARARRPRSRPRRRRRPRPPRRRRPPTRSSRATAGTPSPRRSTCPSTASCRPTGPRCRHRCTWARCSRSRRRHRRRPDRRPTRDRPRRPHASDSTGLERDAAGVSRRSVSKTATGSRETEPPTRFRRRRSGRIDHPLRRS